MRKEMRGFELIIRSGRGETDEEGLIVEREDNPNKIEANLVLHRVFVDDDTGEEMVKTIHKSTYDPLTMRRWAKKIVGIKAGGDIAPDLNLVKDE
jgi:hypothetical protein